MQICNLLNRKMLCYRLWQARLTVCAAAKTTRWRNHRPETRTARPSLLQQKPVTRGLMTARFSRRYACCIADKVVFRRRDAAKQSGSYDYPHTRVVPSVFGYGVVPSGHPHVGESDLALGAMILAVIFSVTQGKKTERCHVTASSAAPDWLATARAVSAP